MPQRLAVLVFGLASYLVFLATFLYAIGFLGGFWVPRTVDVTATTGGGASAVLINLGLLALFAVQHSVMARRGFKRWLTNFIPVAAERSVYVLASSLALIALFVFWQPLGPVVWHIASEPARWAIHALFAIGWVIVLASTYLINHFDLFGLRQVWLHWRRIDYTPVPFRTPWPYRVVRHPLYVGWLIAFWATPTMSAAHLVFAVAMTVYILVAIKFEERDLVAEHGERYASYRKQVPALIPGLSWDNGRGAKSAVHG